MAIFGAAYIYLDLYTVKTVVPIDLIIMVGCSILFGLLVIPLWRRTIV